MFTPLRKISSLWAYDLCISANLLFLMLFDLDGKYSLNICIFYIWSSFEHPIFLLPNQPKMNHFFLLSILIGALTYI